MQTFSCASLTFPSVNCATNITENSNKSSILQIWPNPCATKINIQLGNTEILIEDIIITNQLGDIIYEIKYRSMTNNQIAIDNLENGIYFIIIKTKNGQFSEKIIVIR